MRCLQARYRYVYPQHLNYFTRATLRQLIQPRFHLLAAGSTHFNPLVLWQDWRRAGRDVSNRERADLLRRTTAYKQNPLLKPLQSIYQVLEQVLGKLNLADNLVVVLRKRGCEATGA